MTLPHIITSTAHFGPRVSQPIGGDRLISWPKSQPRHRLTRRALAEATGIERRRFYQDGQAVYLHLPCTPTA